MALEKTIAGGGRKSYFGIGKGDLINHSLFRWFPGYR
jgi:hypothetical protein